MTPSVNKLDLFRERSKSTICAVSMPACAAAEIAFPRAGRALRWLQWLPIGITLLALSPPVAIRADEKPGADAQPSIAPLQKQSQPTANSTPTPSRRQRAGQRPTLSIELHPDWCHVRGVAVDSANAQALSDTIADAFPRRCFSGQLSVAKAQGTGGSPSGNVDLPLDLRQLPDLLNEMAASGRPMRIDWFADSRRIALHGHSFSDVTLAAIELRLRLAAIAKAQASAGSGVPSELLIRNHIAVVDPPRHRESKAPRHDPNISLATIIEREFADIKLPLLPPVQLQPIYFTHRDTRLDSQELPKLDDAIDQLSTCRDRGVWPKVVVTAYALPEGDNVHEVAAGLRRATTVRDHMVALGIPADCFTLETVVDESSNGLTWRSHRVEISVDSPPESDFASMLAVP